MKRRSVRMLFVSVLVLLPLHYGLIGLLQVTGLVAREPWPAVVFPGFKDVWDGPGAVSVPHVRTFVGFADGTRAPVEAARLLAPLPSSHHPAFFDAQCGPAPRSPGDGGPRCLQPEAVAWLAARLETLFPGRHPSRLDVVRGGLVVRPGTRSALWVPEDTVAIALSPHPAAP